jgi:hypothetical protein
VPDPPEDRFFALHLNHDFVLHNQISPIPALKLYGAVYERHSLLPLHIKSSLFEFIGETSLISRFQRPGPKLAMNLDRCPDDLVCHMAAARALKPTAILDAGIRNQPEIRVHFPKRDKVLTGECAEKSPEGAEKGKVSFSRRSLRRFSAISAF